MFTPRISLALLCFRTGAGAGEAAPNLELFQGRLDRAGSNLGLDPCPWIGDGRSFKVLSNPFNDFMIHPRANNLEENQAEQEQLFHPPIFPKERRQRGLCGCFRMWGKLLGVREALAEVEPSQQTLNPTLETWALPEPKMLSVA